MDFSREIKPAGLKVKTEKIFTVESYDSQGNLRTLSPLNRAGLSQLVDRKGLPVTHVIWQPPETVEATDTEEISLDIFEDEDPFDQISEQLEQLNITSWKGLIWQRHGHNLEIVRDDNVLETPFTYSDLTPTRTWIINVTKDVGGQTHLVEKRVMKDKELRDYFADVAKVEPAFHPKLIRNVPAAEETETVNPDDLEEGLASLRVAVEEETAGLPCDEADKTAAWLLSGADAVVGDWEDAEAERFYLLGQFARESGLLLPKVEPTDGPDLSESNLAFRRKEGLKALIDEKGLGKVIEVALDLKKNFEESMNALNFPVAKGNRSIAWAIEALVDNQYYLDNPDKVDAAHQGFNFGELFSNDLATKLRHRDLVDKQIAKDFIDSVVVKIKRTKPVDGQVNEFGQPVHKVVEDVLFNKLPIEVLQNLTKSRVRSISEDFYDRIKKKRVVMEREFRDLGRLLRRSVAR